MKRHIQILKHLQFLVNQLPNNQLHDNQLKHKGLRMATPKIGKKLKNGVEQVEGQVILNPHSQSHSSPNTM